MRRTYVNEIAECYRHKEEDFDQMMGSFGETLQDCWPLEAERQEMERMFNKKMLVVDDESNIRSTYRRIFSREGFDVLTAANAMEAKDLLVRERVGLVFLDINMTEVDGEDLFELLRAFHPDVKVVVSSVYPVEEQRERIKNADAYFDKSDGKDVLLRMVSVLSRMEGYF